MISGAIQYGVPMTVFCFDMVDCNCALTPKSAEERGGRERENEFDGQYNQHNNGNNNLKTRNEYKILRTQFGLPIFGQQDVSRFNVSMDIFILVQVRQSQQRSTNDLLNHPCQKELCKGKKRIRFRLEIVGKQKYGQLVLTDSNTRATLHHRAHDTCQTYLHSMFVR